MKKLFTFVLPALFVLMATSCKPSLEGTWLYEKTECYEDGKLVEVDDEEFAWTFRFNDNGTGFEYDEGDGGAFYWKYVGGILYMDDDPILNLKKAPSLKVKSLERKELQLMWTEDEEYGDYAEVYVFRKK